MLVMLLITYFVKLSKILTSHGIFMDIFGLGVLKLFTCLEEANIVVFFHSVDAFMLVISHCFLK